MIFSIPTRSQALTRTLRTVKVVDHQVCHGGQYCSSFWPSFCWYCSS